MHGLRHKKLTSKQGAARGGSNQTGFSHDGVQSKRSNGDHAGTSKRGCVDGIKSNRANTRRAAALAGSSERISACGGNSETVGAGGGNSTNMGGTDGSHTERMRVDGVNSTMVAAVGEHSERTSANGVNSLLNSASEGGNSELNIGSKRVREDVPKRGRAKMSRTELKMAPRSGRVELEPRGHRQFKYVNYNPKGLKYPSQVGAILKREYPGMIKVYDEHGTVVKHQPAMSWNDYCWKKNKNGICYAKRVKQEFWSLFTVHLRHRAAAAKVLDAYLVKRVTNMVYQLRLEAVKIYFNRRNEACDDTRARTIELTEEQYLTCRVDWCNKVVWTWFSQYWASDEYKRKRLKAQESSMNSEDTAQNRGGSRNFSETQQLLEHNFGSDKGSTLNTYAVMKSGYKIVDSTSRSGPIPSQKAQRRLIHFV